MNNTPSTTSVSPPALIVMEQHAILSVKGPDAAKFLQGQCTCDILQAKDGTALLGAHCNAKGRIISSFLLLQIADDEFCLRMRADIIESTLNSLKKYSVFFKVVLSISPLTPIALLNADILQANEYTDLELPQLPEPGQSTHKSHLILCQHNNAFWEIWTPLEHMPALCEKLTKLFSTADTNTLNCRFIELGIAEITASTQGEYVPHELNFQLLDAISFNKGCYTGQEIIARMQYRAQLKKHTYRACIHTNSAIEIGSSIVSTTNTEQTLGTIIAVGHQQPNTKNNSSPYYQALIATTANAYTQKETLVEKKSMAKVTWTTLPYAIP